MDKDWLLNDQDYLTFVNCFICLEPVPPTNINDETIALLNFLFGYLKIEEKFNSFVCVKCGDNLTKFVKLCGCEVSEKVRLEMDYLLGNMKRAILNSNKVFKPGADELTRVREAVLEKCKEMICNRKPEIILKRIDLSKSAEVERRVPVDIFENEWVPGVDECSATPVANDVKDLKTEIIEDEDARENPTASTSKKKTKSRTTFFTKGYLKFRKDANPLLKRLFKCSICHRSFTQIGDLRRHFKRLHLLIKPYKCDLCEKSFPQNYVLRLHKAKFHFGKRKRTSRPYLSGDETFPCHICNKSFKARESLEEHVSATDGMRTLHCQVPGCNKTYGNFCSLSLHYQKDHPDFSLGDSKKYSTSTENGESVVECKLCGNKFKNVTLVNCHIKNVHEPRKYKCPDCNFASPQKSKLEAHIKRMHLNRAGLEESLKPHKCDVCKKSFINYGTLLHHKVTHVDDQKEDLSEDNSLKCTKCSKTFSCKATLVNHIRVVHLRLLPYKCDVCNKPFARARALRLHKDKPHNPQTKPIKSFYCGICAKFFRKSWSLRNHKKVVHQVEERTFACRICKKEFEAPSNLQMHYSEVHKKDRHFCQVASCGKDYCRSDGLLNHYRLEHPDLVAEKPPRKKYEGKRYHCQGPGCNKSYIQASMLRRHFRLEHEQKDVVKGPFEKYTFIIDHGLSLAQCTFCKSRFKSVDEVEGHIDRIHSTRFKCKDCDFESIQESNLGRHIEQNHKKEEVKTESVNNGMNNEFVIL